VLAATKGSLAGKPNIVHEAARIEIPTIDYSLTGLSSNEGCSGRRNWLNAKVANARNAITERIWQRWSSTT
jgi:hypothetical protein